MIEYVKSWFRRSFGDPDVAGLVVTIVVILVLFYFFGRLLAPVIAAVVIAYMLDGAVKFLMKWKCPHILAVCLVFIIAIALVVLALLWLLPLLWQQVANLVAEAPKLFSQGNAFIKEIQQHLPEFITAEQLTHAIDSLKIQIATLGKTVLSYSLASIPNVIALIVYLILVPLMVFFFLKDRESILAWFAGFMPHKRRLLIQVYHEVNAQIAAYIRAKVLEIIIVSVVTVITFLLMGIHYAVLLGVLVGLSTLIPFVGVTVVTIPVVLVAFFQWGWSAHFIYLVIAYTVIAVIDGNVLAPLLFSEAVKLNPVAVIIAIIVFGGFWGFWGVFFAIPLATVVKAILNAWPQKPALEAEM